MGSITSKSSKLEKNEKIFFEKSEIEKEYCDKELQTEIILDTSKRYRFIGQWVITGNTNLMAA